MKASVKVILSLAGVAGISYGAYRIYKWWKEEEALEAEGLSYEELVAEAEAKKIEEEMAERKRVKLRMNAIFVSSKDCQLMTSLIGSRQKTDLFVVI